MNIFSRKFQQFALLFIWLLLLIAIIVRFDGMRNNYDLNEEAESINKSFLEIEAQILNYVSDEQVTHKLVTDSYTFEDFKALNALPFGLAAYVGDSAIMWTNNSIIPVNAQLVNDDKPQFIAEKNGSYVLYQHLFNNNIRTIAFLPLQTDYGIDNEYLKNVKSTGLTIPNFFTVQVNKQAGAFPIVNSDLETVFYLVPDANIIGTIKTPTWIMFPMLLFFAISILLVYRSAANLKLSLSKKILFLITLLVTFIVIVNFLSTRFLSEIALFNSETYGSGYPMGSLGSLFLICSSIIAIAYFLVKGVKREQISRGGKYLLVVILSSLIFFAVHVSNSLVKDSSIVFNIQELFAFDAYSLIAVLSIALVCLSAGLISNRLVTVFSDDRIWLIVVGLFSTLFWTVLLWLGRDELPVVSLISALIVFGIIILFNKLDIRPSSLLVHLTWLIIFSGIIAFVISGAMFDKSEQNKRLFAFKKSVEKDALAEFLFEEQKIEIQRMLDVQFEGKSGSVINIKQGLVNQIKQALQANYFKKYDVEVYLFRGKDFVAGSGGNEQPNIASFIDAIENNGAYTSAENLYFINDYTGNYYYQAELKSGDSSELITTYILLLPKRFNSESLYPELLIDNDLRLSPGFRSFNYAVYYNNNLIERKGEYSYPVMDVFYMPKGQEWDDKVVNGYDHFIYVVNDQKKVVVSNPDRNLSDIIGYFSFLFFFFLIFYGAVIFIQFFAQLFDEGSSLRDMLETSLQSKIQLAIVSLVIFTFLSLGIATVIYITKQYDRTNEQQLLEKIEAVKTNIDYLSSMGRPNAEVRRVNSSNKMAQRLTELSEVHNMDINLYNRNGLLQVSSQPDIFNKGLVSEKMNPLAYFKMTCEKETWYIHNESIGKLSFLSAYVPILDKSGEVLYYLNLPYFATQQDLQKEISSFLVTLVNVYVLLLVIAAIIALIVSRNITSPLNTITGTFKSVQLGRKNEPIIWPHEDEIGLMVREYNKMLVELDKSAQLLANTERETAWRDMAKQVAHEIKNPLTPMRLSIQHLQRAIDNKSPDIESLTAKVSETLMEQIDNLTFIASEFSNFAVMPKAQNELLDINELLENTGNLFKQSDEAEIILQLSKEPFQVYADKNQISRVFTNLIKNGLQAIPEDKLGVIQIESKIKGERVVCSISDNGKGIPEELREKVFVPNFTTKSSGMGIGLALSKNIIEQAGGHIWYESEQNVGTTFYVELPLSKPDLIN